MRPAGVVRCSLAGQLTPMILRCSRFGKGVRLFFWRQPRRADFVVVPISWCKTPACVFQLPVPPAVELKRTARRKTHWCFRAVGWGFDRCPGWVFPLGGRFGAYEEDPHPCPRLFLAHASLFFFGGGTWYHPGVIPATVLLSKNRVVRSFLQPAARSRFKGVFYVWTTRYNQLRKWYHLGNMVIPTSRGRSFRLELRRQIFHSGVIMEGWKSIQTPADF